MSDGADNLLQSQRGIYPNALLRLLQRRKLAFQQLWVHEMPPPLQQSLADYVLIGLEIDQRHLRIHQQILPIDLLQRRASEHRIRVLGETTAHEVAQSLQPWQAVGIVQGDAPPHFVNVGTWMKIVCIVEL